MPICELKAYEGAYHHHINEQRRHIHAQSHERGYLLQDLLLLLQLPRSEGVLKQATKFIYFATLLVGKGHEK